MKTKTIIILGVILILASFLRLWELGKVPISPDWDEAALGYNAYSILQTGRDEYGKFLPIVLRSFDDYKPALYAYFAIPSIVIFGLNTFAVRLPSAIFGILTVLATFFLVKELFKGAGLKLEIGNWKLEIPEVAALLLAISPWHIQFSRVAFEANVGVALNVFGILFFLTAFKRPRFLLLSALMLGLSLHVYQSEKVFVPLLIAILVASFRKEFFLIRKKYIYTSLIIFTIICLPLIFFTLTNKDVLSRAKGVSIFSNASIIEANTEKIARDKANNDILGLVLDNRRVEFAKYVAGGYLSHLDLNWLFIKGDIARHHASGMGLMYLTELPFLLVGIYILIFGNFSKAVKIFTILWFLIAPIPASITSGVPHAVRTLNFLPAFQIFTAIGILSTIALISNFKSQILNFKIWKLFAICYLLFAMFNFLYYIDQYFVQQNYFHARYWQYGYKEIVDFIAPIHKNYNKIIVSNVGLMDQSYIFFLFYLKYDPQKYLSNGGTSSGGFKESGDKFDNFEFRPFNYYSEKESNILLVGTQDDFAEEFHTIKRIDYPDKSSAVRVVDK